MKLKNVKVGQTVKVKKTLRAKSTFYRESIGKVGTVIATEPPEYAGYLSVRVQFTDDCVDWGNHNDIKLLEDVD